MKQSILIITQQYPKKGDYYKNKFVHTRVKSYKKYNSEIEVRVFVLNGKNSEYVYENIHVIEGTKRRLKKYLRSNRIDMIHVHFLTKNMMRVLLTNATDIPVRIWVHGYEALHWKRRSFNSKDWKFLGYILNNLIQLKFFKYYVIKSTNSEFIFVSNWMKTIAEKDIQVTFKNYRIIPNGIDTKFFAKLSDKSELRKKILVIRPFSSRKYATDIVCKTVERFSNMKEFNEYEFTIIGEGKYFEEDTKKIRIHENVKIINKFLNEREIKDYHNKHGVFLCPTRQDAQGVSMCEAMSSGLVPITSNNTAIPEFVSNKSGILTDNSTDEIIKAIILLGNNKETFSKMSEEASKSISSMCSLSKITINELK